MSYDRAIDQICPHLVTEEALFVSGDRRTIRPLRPISSAVSVKVRMNAAYDVPSTGARVPAKAIGNKRGPYTLTQNVNDKLILKIGQGATQTIILPHANQVGAPQLASRLNYQLQGAYFTVNNDKLVLLTQESGLGSSILIDAHSTAATTLGFLVNHEYRGRDLTSGWFLVNDPNTLLDRPTRLIVFDTPLRGGSDFVEISYTTVREECRRCGGTGVEYDWRYTSQGEIELVSDIDLLVQEIQKDMYTIRGSNLFHSWYGTGIIEAIGKKNVAGGYAQNMLVSDIHQAFANWQEIKTRQESMGQEVSDKEFPFRLLSVNLTQDPQDPTIINVEMTVQSRSREPIQLVRGLRVPGQVI